MPKEFSPEIKKEAEAVIAQYPSPASAILPLMHLAEREFQVVDADIEKMLAEMCRITQVRAHEIWTFYHMYVTKPRGKYHFRVCHNISCTLLGAEDIISHLMKKFGLDSEGTTEDGLFSLERVECLGACEGSPSMLVNEDLHSLVSIGELDDLIERLKKKESGK